MTLTCTNVTLRQKPLHNDRISLYLDYYPAIRNPYTMKMSRREFLGIYIYAKPKNEQQRMFNQDMLNKAEAVSYTHLDVYKRQDFNRFTIRSQHKLAVRKGHHESAPHSYFGLYGNLSSQSLHDALADGEPQTRALNKIVQLFETVENQGQFLLRNAATGIRYIHLQPFSADLQPQGDGPFMGILNGIREKVEQHLRNPVPAVSYTHLSSGWPSPGFCAEGHIPTFLFPAVRSAFHGELYQLQTPFPFHAVPYLFLQLPALFYASHEYHPNGKYTTNLRMQE